MWEEDMGMESNEEKRGSGAFSVGLKSLELQISGLFEGTGGHETVELLDTLSGLSGAEQRISLKLFTNILKRMAASNTRLHDQDEEQLKLLEEQLYNDIVNRLQLSGMDKASRHIAPKLAVLTGGMKGKLSRLSAKRGGLSRKVFFGKKDDLPQPA
jgi:hypothetical protein